MNSKLTAINTSRNKLAAIKFIAPFTFSLEQIAKMVSLIRLMINIFIVIKSCDAFIKNPVTSCEMRIGSHIRNACDVCTNFYHTSHRQKMRRHLRASIRSHCQILEGCCQLYNLSHYVSWNSIFLYYIFIDPKCIKFLHYLFYSRMLPIKLKINEHSLYIQGEHCRYIQGVWKKYSSGCVKFKMI